MESTEAQDLIQQLVTGFETLQEEYQKLFSRHEALDRQLSTARTQYNELAKLCGSASLATPPLSLASASPTHASDALPSAGELIELQPEHSAKAAAGRVRAAYIASCRLKAVKPSPVPNAPPRSGLSPSVSNSGRCMMPSITESPLEQDFTVEGTPSKLGCPFASMVGKPMSSHAASVLSRYKSGGSGVAASASTGPASVHRIDGRASFSSRQASRRGSIADPIKAEICGLSDHRGFEKPEAEQDVVKVDPQPNATDSGVCPIRFLDQHSPEEVATYFEKHKHELPRSHEDCVKRYQSNEAQIRELDSRYGNLVSMIQGLGGIHQPMLPPEPDEVADVEDATALSGEGAEKVRKWASSVSLAPMELEITPENEDIQHQVASIAPDDSERVSHFERPLRDIRVGESPSRPWGIAVPARFLEKVAGVSDASSQPARIDSSHGQPAVEVTDPHGKPLDDIDAPRTKGKCPFDFSKLSSGPLPAPESLPQHKHVKLEAPIDGPQQHTGAAFIAPDSGPALEHGGKSNASPPRMVFTGPVFIGYSAEDAARIIRDSALGSAS